MVFPAVVVPWQLMTHPVFAEVLPFRLWVKESSIQIHIFIFKKYMNLNKKSSSSRVVVWVVTKQLIYNYKKTMRLV